jgi:exonuclease-1
MGVKGLLPCLQSITRQVPLEKYQGLSVAVDAMCWLHKGIFTGNVGALAKHQFMEKNHCHEVDDQCHSSYERNYQIEANDTNELLKSAVKQINFDEFTSSRKHRLNKPLLRSNVYNVEAIEAMSKCIDYVTRHTIELQKKYGLDVILIIDGNSLPSKHAVDEKRRAVRKEAFALGLQAEKRGDGRQARKYFSQACSITYEMRHELMKQCRRYRIPFIVAPYEADAQLAKLAHSGAVDLVITEDSDLLVFGCPRVLFKIDFKSCKGEEIQLMRDLVKNEPLSFRHWTHDMFVYMCILAGCDYCPGVSGIGIQTAHKLVRIHRKPKKIFNALKNDGKLEQGFEDVFMNAYRTFRHQRVYCPQKREIGCLFDINDADKGHLENWKFLGIWMDPIVGIGVAEGLLHPREKKTWEEVEKCQTVNFHSKSQVGSTFEKSHNNRKRTSTQRSPIVKMKKQIDKIDCSEGRTQNDKNLFAFFRPQKKRSHQHPKQLNRPPLEEIQFGESNKPSKNSFSMNLNEGLDKLHRCLIPSNSNEYSSHLVSGNFEPISRNSTWSKHRRSGITKALRDLKLRLSMKRSNFQNEVIQIKDVATFVSEDKKFGEKATINEEIKVETPLSQFHDLPNYDIDDTTNYELSSIAQQQDDNMISQFENDESAMSQDFIVDTDQAPIQTDCIHHPETYETSVAPDGMSNFGQGGNFSSTHLDLPDCMSVTMESFSSSDYYGYDLDSHHQHRQHQHQHQHQLEYQEEHQLEYQEQHQLEYQEQHRQMPTFSSVPAFDGQNSSTNLLPETGSTSSNYTADAGEGFTTNTNSNCLSDSFDQFDVNNSNMHEVGDILNINFQTHQQNYVDTITEEEDGGFMHEVNQFQSL